jgi:hypothetical protein
VSVCPNAPLGRPVACPDDLIKWQALALSSLPSRNEPVVGRSGGLQLVPNRRFCIHSIAHLETAAADLYHFAGAVARGDWSLTVGTGYLGEGVGGKVVI